MVLAALDSEKPALETVSSEDIKPIVQIRVRIIICTHFQSLWWMPESWKKRILNLDSIVLTCFLFAIFWSSKIYPCIQLWNIEKLRAKSKLESLKNDLNPLFLKIHHRYPNPNLDTLKELRPPLDTFYLSHLWINFFKYCKMYF